MAEQQAPGMAPPMPTGVPPTQNASYFSASLTVSEILVAIGHTRMAMVPDQNQNIAPLLMQEWFLTLSVSPSAALMLHKVLERTLQAYEERFGKIPEDKEARLDVQDRTLPAGKS